MRINVANGDKDMASARNERIQGQKAGHPQGQVFGDREASTQRQPTHGHGEDQLQHQPQKKARHRDGAQGHHAGQVIGPAVALSRRP